MKNGNALILKIALGLVGSVLAFLITFSIRSIADSVDELKLDVRGIKTELQIVRPADVLKAINDLRVEVEKLKG